MVPSALRLLLPLEGPLTGSADLLPCHCATHLPTPQELKGFLGFELHLPSDSLPLTNWKHNRGGPDAVGGYLGRLRCRGQGWKRVGGSEPRLVFGTV